MTKNSMIKKRKLSINNLFQITVYY